MILLFPSLIKFENEEDQKKFAPKCHMFYNQRVIDIPDGLPKWDGINGQSNLVADSPADLVKEEERKKFEEVGDEDGKEHRSKRQKIDEME